jgi:hypothetical protein
VGQVEGVSAEAMLLAVPRFASRLQQWFPTVAASAVDQVEGVSAEATLLAVPRFASRLQQWFPTVAASAVGQVDGVSAEARQMPASGSVEVGLEVRAMHVWQHVLRIWKE